ncbi:hypothetical protein D3C78_1926400 [compost metagenome]
MLEPSQVRDDVRVFLQLRGSLGRRLRWAPGSQRSVTLAGPGEASLRVRSLLFCQGHN